MRLMLFVIVIVLIITNIHINISNDTNDHNNIYLDSSCPIIPSYRNDERNSGYSPYNISENPGRLIWRSYFSGQRELGSIVIDSEENSWVVNETYIVKIDKNGYHLFNNTIRPKHKFFSAPLLDSNNNFFICIENQTDPFSRTYSILSLYPNGTKYWEKLVSGHQSIPVIKNDIIYFFTKYNDNGICYSIFSNGTTNWKYNFGATNNYRGSPAIDSDGNVYFIDDDRRDNSALYSIYPNGTLRWKYDLTYSIATPSIDFNDNIYLSSSNKVIGINNNGTLKWQTNVSIQTVQTPITIDKHNNLYCQAGGNNGNIICSLYPNGTINWTIIYGDELTTTITVSNDGYIVLGLSDGELRVLDNNRKLKWYFNIGKDIESFPVISPDGSVYFTCEDGYYYKIGMKTPSPPENLVGNYRDNHVLLKWDPPTDTGGLGVDEFRIYRGIYEYYEFYIGSVNGTETQYNDTDVMNGLTYFYYVTAVNLINESNPSNRIEGCPTGLADPPYQIQMRNVDDGIEFKWKPPIEKRGTDILSYILYRSIDNISFERHVLIPSAFSSFVDEDIDKGTIYHYYMRTKNKNGEGERSEIFTIVSIGKPSTPRNFQLVAGDGFVNLSWSPLDHTGGLPLKYFNIFRRSNNLPTMVVRPSPDRLSYNDTNVTNGKRYWYSIGASNDYGLSVLTDEIEALPLGIPDPPENFSCERFGTSIKLTWTLPLYDGGTDRTSFRIFRMEKGIDHTDKYDVDPLSRSWIDEDLANGTTYVYFMRSVNIIGESIPTEKIEMKIVGISGPPVLKNVTLENDSLVIKWDIPQNTYGSELILYRVYRYDNPHFADIIGETSDLMYYDSDFSYGNEYRYFVTVDCQVYESVIESEKSNQLSIKPLTIPDPPSLSYSNFGDGFVEFRLSPPTFKGGSDTIWYEVFKTNNDQIYPKIVIGSNMTSYHDEDVINGEIYQYYIYSVNEIGYSNTNTSFEIKPLGLPSKPIDFQMELDGDEMVLSWNTPVDDGGEISGYHIFKGNNTNSLSLIDTVVNESYIDFVESDGIYFYQVIAYNDAGEGEGSEVLSIKVDREKDERMDLTPLIIGSIVILLCIILFFVFILKGRNKLYEE